jgi:hypothetical protein
MDLHEVLARTGEMLLGRTTGPLTLRLILQPSMAALFAIRAAIKDTRDGHSEFFLRGLFDHAQRSEMLRAAKKDVGKIFVIAMALDVVYQIKVFQWVYPLQIVIVATVLAIVPYVLIRGIVTRLMIR